LTPQVRTRMQTSAPVEANWQHAGMFRSGKATISSLPRKLVLLYTDQRPANDLSRQLAA
jgi:hypothetical protein